MLEEKGGVGQDVRIKNFKKNLKIIRETL